MWAQGDYRIAGEPLTDDEIDTELEPETDEDNVC
jgi:hypothetical protein